MSQCYVCEHEITAICALCGSELTITDERGVEGPRDQSTEIRIQPCGCAGGRLARMAQGGITEEDIAETRNPTCYPETH